MDSDLLHAHGNPDAVAGAVTTNHAGEAAPAQPFADIVIRRMAYLRGPSIWTYRPVIEAVVDIGELENFPSNTLPGFYERLTRWLPGLIEHRCSVGRRGGFLMRLRDGTWPGHILEHVALELQTQAGMKTGFGKARMTHEQGVYKVVIRTRDEAVGRAAIEAARDLVMAAINHRPFDVPAVIARLKDMVDRRCLGPSTASIVEAASERGIPALRLNSGNLVQLGHGAAQRRIWTAETDCTSAIAEGIARDKTLTKTLLSACGVPVPAGCVVHSGAEAWEAAEDIGLPVVVKPSDASQARGVSLHLHTRQEVEEAFTAAEQEGGEVMVERCIAGEPHRLLVVGHKVVAAIRGETARIHGDGRTSVAGLIASQINTDPRRGAEARRPLAPLNVQDPAVQRELARQGLTAASVLPVGRSAVVQRTGNLIHDVTALVHPDVAHQASLAARAVGLDIAGIDLVTPDISQPLAAQGGAIIEVDAGPSLLMHLQPAVGRAQPVGEAIVGHLFPPGENGRIPIVGITGGADDGHASLAARLIARLLNLSGRLTALACADGLYLGPRQLAEGHSLGWEAGERMLINRTVQAAVLQTTARHILTEGLPYDRCLIGVVTAMPSPAGLHDLYITEAGQMPGIIRTQVDVVLPSGCAVLNADDPGVAELAGYSDGDVIFYATDAANPAVAAHRASGGRAVLANGSALTLAKGRSETTLLDLAAPAFAAFANLAASADQPARAHDIRPAVMAAAAAAWALGIAPDLIRAGLQSQGQPLGASA